jgi:hypothetical protein
VLDLKFSQLWLGCDSESKGEANYKQSSSILSYSSTLKMESVCSCETSIGLDGVILLFFNINILLNDQGLTQSRKVRQTTNRALLF